MIRNFKYTLVYVGILITLLTLVSGASEVDSDEQIFKQSYPSTIVIGCEAGTTGSGARCASNALCNLTVSYPNGTFLFTNASMNNFREYFTYNLTSTQTEVVGIYQAIAHCTDPIGSDVLPFSFQITPTGENISTSHSIIYFIALFILTGLFIFCIYLGSMIPITNTRNDEGFIIAVNWRKYLKITGLYFAYLTLMWICWTMFNITGAYVAFTPVSNYFGIIYRLMLALVVPLAIGIGLVSLVVFVRDLKIERKIEKGFFNIK